MKITILHNWWFFFLVLGFTPSLPGPRAPVPGHHSIPNLRSHQTEPSNQSSVSNGDNGWVHRSDLDSVPLRIVCRQRVGRSGPGILRQCTGDRLPVVVPVVVAVVGHGMGRNASRAHLQSHVVQSVGDLRRRALSVVCLDENGGGRHRGRGGVPDGTWNHRAGAEGGCHAVFLGRFEGNDGAWVQWGSTQLFPAFRSCFFSLVHLLAHRGRHCFADLKVLEDDISDGDHLQCRHFRIPRRHAFTVAKQMRTILPFGVRNCKLLKKNYSPNHL